MTAIEQWVNNTRTFAAHVTTGFLKMTHNGFAFLGLALAFSVKKGESSVCCFSQFTASRASFAVCTRPR